MPKKEIMVGEGTYEIKDDQDLDLAPKMGFLKRWKLNRIAKKERKKKIGYGKKGLLANAEGGTVVVGGGGGVFSWMVASFLLSLVIGWIAYGNFQDAFFLGIFSCIAILIHAMVFALPVVGEILWFFINFVWGWGGGLAGMLNLPVDGSTGFCWWSISIFSFIIGIIVDIVIVLFIASIYAD